MSHHRWRRLSTVPFPDSPRRLREHAGLPEGAHRVYLSRTLAEIEAGPRRSIVREIEFLFRDLIRLAQHRIILEGQYYWSEEINDMLVAKIHEMRGKDFEIILVLADTHRLKGLTRAADSPRAEASRKSRIRGAKRGGQTHAGLSACSPSRPRAAGESKPIYIHSKVIIIDDALSLDRIGEPRLARAPT